MKSNKNTADTASTENIHEKNTRPQKVLLHIAHQDGKWTGRAISYERKEEILFGSLADLVDWLSNDNNKTR